MQTQNSADISPFIKDNDNDAFFPGAGRGTLLVQLHNAIVDDAFFVTVTGEEGSGKSFLCNAVVKKLPSYIIPVNMPAGIESFEEIVQLITSALDLALPENIEQPTVQDKLEHVRKKMEDEALRVVLIFDDAEYLYLATLERTRKIIEQVNDGESLFTLLLVGRERLVENLRQLSMCNFASDSEKHFLMEAMTADDTFEYLNFSMHQAGDTVDKEIFSREASDKIFELSAGNFKKTNELAEKALENVDQDTSFLVLLDNVQDDEEEEKTVRRKLSISGWRNWKQAGLIAGGIAGLLLLLLFVLPDKPRKPVETLKKDAERNVTQVKETPFVVQSGAEQQEENVVKTQAVKNAVEAEKQQPPPVVISAPEQSKVPEREAIVTEDKKSSDIDEKLVEKTVQLVPRKKKKIITTKTNTIEENAKSLSRKKTSTRTDRYDDRVVAGADWLRGGDAGRYTVQLMALTSTNAEQNLRKLLKKKEYNRVIDKLYILQKTGAESSVLVFYGTYSTMSEARNARDALPQVLREHHPYAISVEGAVNKLK